jgi:trimeric autotransporter adhesin
MKLRNLTSFITFGALAALSLQLSAAPSTAFTYQGRLSIGGNVADGIYDLKFTLYDGPLKGTLVAGPITNSAVSVSNGLFTVTLDLGVVAFSGADRWLRISARSNNVGAFVDLAPFQKVTPTPYAITAGNLEGVLPSSQLAGTYGNIVTFNNAGNSFAGNGAELAGVNATTLGGLGPGNFWKVLGNGGTTPGVNFLGTTDNMPLELKVNGQRAFRLEPTTNSPNLIGGWAGNFAESNLLGITIGGGGSGTALNSVRDYSPVWPSGSAIASHFSTIGGGVGNIVSPRCGHSTISGGATNGIGTADYDPAANNTIGGGAFNSIGDSTSGVISGGQGNYIFGDTRNFSGGANLGCTISGGASNSVAGYSGFDTSGATIAGGKGNSISYASHDAVIGGGMQNYVRGLSAHATIGGGFNNLILPYSQGATIGGGRSNVVSGGAYFTPNSYATIAGGDNNQVTGVFGIIPGGNNNVATNYAFAGGHRAKALQPGSFVWADAIDVDYAPWLSVALGGQSNSFNVRATGGFFIWTAVNGSGDGTAGTYISKGGSGWNAMSDRNAKINFATVDTREILNRLVAVPVMTWNYKAQDSSIRHIGPMAQDFNAAFDTGDSDKTGEKKYINSVDADGVALAAIKGLNEVVMEKETRIQALEKDVAELKQLVRDLRLQSKGVDQ